MWVSCASQSPPSVLKSRFQSKMRQDWREPQMVYSTKSGPTPPTLPATDTGNPPAVSSATGTATSASPSRRRAVSGVRASRRSTAPAARARERLEKGEPVEALHLVDAVLEVAPEHRDALELSLAVHEELEKQSENFWLSSWLRKQMGDLRQRLGRGN